MSKRTLAILGLVLVMVIWGSAFAVTKASLATIPPIVFAFLRFTVASILLLSLSYARRRGIVATYLSSWRTLSLMGLMGITLYYLSYNLALLYTTASQGALIQSGIPVATALLAVFLLKERISAWQATGIGLSILGVAMVVLNSPPSGEARNPLLGSLLMLGTVLLWSLYTIFAKRLMHADQLLVTTTSTVFGTLLLAPIAVFELWGQALPVIPPGAWFRVLYLGALSSAGCYLLYNWSLTHLEASQTANFINLIPIIGITIAVLFLGEAIVPLQLFGGLLVLLGVWLAA
jgi:drug/metabolite transporter (DMT)-like permease